MSVFARTNRTIVGEWWWTVDRLTLAGIGALVTLGIIMILAASPPVARNLALPETHFIVRHLTYLLPTAGLLFFVSLLAPRGVLRLAWALLVVMAALTLATLFFGPEIKGSHRWLLIAGMQLQPSEFLKPALVVVAAWLISRHEGMGGLLEAVALVFCCAALLLLQPDLGMAVLIAAVFCVQLFMAGIAWGWITLMGAGGVFGLWGAYHLLPHVRERIDGFLDPSGEVYQVERALRAVASGGLFGRGPGEGVVKYQLPEAHSDFVFAAAAEEFGVIACLVIIAVFAFIVLRALYRVQLVRDRFTELAAVGLIAQFGLQALINMGVNLNLLPTKGMTLPFISYGGSSLLALAVGMGMLLALTRRGAALEPRP